MKDPLDLGNAAQELFLRIWAQLEGAPMPVVHNIALNILMNAIRMTTPTRQGAEEQIDNALGRAKSILLEGHYDAVTGRRKSLFPYTQMAQAPFHPSENKIFPAGE
jgi:hypothetical protein